MSGTDADVTGLLVRIREGDAEARGLAFSALYTELHRLAVHRMRGENRQHTLQPTALVHEAYLRLTNGSRDIRDRHHFFALASQAMRRVLVDYARQKRALKRGGGAIRVLTENLGGAEAPNVDVLALDEALTELATLDAQAARVVELRFFGGHTDQEVCELLGENLPRVRRDWEFARSWLKHKLAV